MNPRDLTVDALRGLAIFVMVSANLAGPGLAQPHPYTLRVYGSFAAPLFLFLSGAMVGRTVALAGRSGRHYLLRGAYILLVAACIDLLLWRVYPFTAMDILYLIGVSIPLVYLCARWRPVAVLLLAASIALAAPVVRNVTGYAYIPFEHAIGAEPPPGLGDLPAIARHWLVDGFFPVLPWLAFPLLGSVWGRLRVAGDPTGGGSGLHTFAAGLSGVAAGVLLWSQQTYRVIRPEASEVFYPATTGYLVTAAGLILCGIALVDLRPGAAVLRPFVALGESSLLAYVLHLVLIEALLAATGMLRSAAAYALAYLLVVAALVAAAHLARRGRVAWPAAPWPVRMFIGSGPS